MEKIKLVFISIIVGFSVAFLYLFVEFIDKQGVTFIWNNLFRTEEYRILVIPVAIFMSILFSLVIISLKQKRIANLDEHLIGEIEIKQTNIKEILKILIIGCIGLLAGASLGPEAILVAVCSNVGIFIAQKAKIMNHAKLFLISSIGALLVGFFGSILPILISIFMIYKSEKKIVAYQLAIPIIAGLSTYVSLYIIKGEKIGFGTIPTGFTFNFPDLIGAFLLGIFGAILALLIKISISKFQVITIKIAKKFHWIISASIFGAVIGTMYFIGGPTIQFSGYEGTAMLLQNGPYALLSLLLILVTKFISTTWSLSSGYKGGLIFPSIFMAIVMSLILSQVHPIIGGTGIIIGATAGMMTAMLPPMIGFILLISMIKLNFILVALMGLAGAITGTKLIALKLNHKDI